MWRFDLDIEEWNPVPIQSTTVPPPRSEFAHSRVEEIIIMFGGKGDTGLLNDLYTYNLRNKEWALINHESTKMPTSRRGACLAAVEGISLIFGGITSAGYSNELWKFDWSSKTYKLLYSGNTVPPAAFTKCQISYDSEDNMMFIVYSGETPSQIPLTEVYSYNLATSNWTYKENSLFYTIANSKTAAFLINDKIIRAGGSDNGYGSERDISIYDTNTGAIHFAGNLPYNTYSAASVFYRDKIYIHGGGDSYGTLLLEDIVKNDLIVIDLNTNCDEENNVCILYCSKGSYSNQGECDVCPEGSYSDTVGSNYCELCPKGYYSNIKGADSSGVCSKCSDGYFNDKEGQSRCLECSISLECPADYEKEKIDRYVSEQPELYEDEYDMLNTSSTYFNILIAIILCISIPILMSFNKTRKIVRSLDLYKLEHNYEVDKVMYIRTTLLGGLFSIVFLFVALSIIFSTSMSFAFNNVVETKALVPMVALEQEYGDVIYT